MKRALLVLLTIMSGYQYSVAQCMMSFNLTTQAQVNMFPTCPTVTGSINISGTLITDLSPLSSITTITGSIRILSTTGLSTLSGLENITSVDGIRIMGNSILTDISALGGATVTSELIIQNNAELSQCCVFKSQIMSSSIPSVIITNNKKSVAGCDSESELLADTSCDLVASAAVPTLGEWSLITLSILMMIIGTISIQERKLKTLPESNDVWT